VYYDCDQQFALVSGCRTGEVCVQIVGHRVLCEDVQLWSRGVSTQNAGADPGRTIAKQASAAGAVLLEKLRAELALRDLGSSA
jgi:hypothetical protein